MSTLSPYWKLIQYVLLAVGGAFAVAIHDGSIDGHDWANLVILAAGAVAVFYAKNTPEQPWAKTVVAIFAAGVTVLTSAWTDGSIGSDEWVQIVLAVIAAANVGAVSNVPPGPQPEASDPVAVINGGRDTDYPYSAGAVE